MKRGFRQLLRAVCFALLVGFVMVGLQLRNQSGFSVVCAEQKQISEEMVKTEVNSQLEGIDIDDLEDFYEREIDWDIFENKTLKEGLREMITSGKILDLGDLLSLLFNVITSEIGQVLKLVALIVAVVGFGSFSQMLEGFGKKTSGISGVVNFFILTVILSIVAAVIADFVGETTQLLYKIKSLMEIISPILLAILITVGGNTLSASLQPSVVILTGGVIEIIVISTSVVVSLYLVLSVLGELSDAIKLDKLKNFVASTYKWLIGLTFTIFMGYLSLNGITASGADNISIKTAKYAIRSYIPLIGGYVSDSYEIFRVGSVLIKNSIGVIGVVILFTLVIGKIVTLVLYNLGFKLASGISEPLSNGKASKFLGSLSTVFNFLIVGIVACFLMSALTLLVVMSAGNIK